MAFDPHKILNEIDHDSLSDREKDMLGWIRHTFHKLAQHMAHHYDDAIRENNNATSSGDATWRETNERMDRIEVFLNTLCKEQPDLPAARLWTAQKAKDIIGVSYETLNVNEMLSRIIDEADLPVAERTREEVEADWDKEDGA